MGTICFAAEMKKLAEQLNDSSYVNQDISINTRRFQTSS